MIIARYYNLVVEIRNVPVSKFDGRPKIGFIQFFDGTDEQFISKYKPDYPNHSLQIFKSSKRPLWKKYRTLIEESVEIKQKLRDYNLSKILDN